MQRTMLAAVKATDEWLIAPGYLMQNFCLPILSIFVHKTCIVGFLEHLSLYTGVNTTGIKYFCPQKKQKHVFHTGRI